MYLTGILKREYWSLTETENPMEQARIVEKIAKDHLVKATADEDYQVIDILNKTFYDPKKNRWVKLNQE